MRLFEVEKKGFFHASFIELEPGTVLTHRGENMADGEIETILEEKRPARRPSRLRSVFVVDDIRSLSTLTISADAYVYRVRPHKSIIRLDHRWVDEMWRILASSHERPSWMEPKLKHFALGYWSGQQRLGLVPMWEFMTPSAVVLGEIEA